MLHSQGSTSSSAGAAIGKRGKPSGRALFGAIHGPRLGRHGRDTGRRHFSRRSSSGRGRGRPTRSRCRDRGHAGDCRPRVDERRRTAVIATRGGRLVLGRVRFSGGEHGPEAFVTDVLGIVETNADNRIAATVVFDPDDLEAAIEELDARYLAGEAAAHSHTWSVIARNNAAFNRRELPSAAPDWVTIDHRRGASFEPGDLTAYIRSGWDIAPDSSVYIETVHRVSDLGAVVTQVSTGTSQQGFEAEWRFICLLTVDGELFSGCELFDEADLDAALARFDELKLAGAAAGKRGKPSGRALRGVLRGPRLGRDGGDVGRRHFH